MSGKCQVLHAGEHLRAVIFCPGAPRLILTFDRYNKRRKGFGRAAESKTLTDAGFAQLTITTRCNDWFINHDTRAIEQVLAQVSQRYDLVHALGFSMGAYGAFRFAQVAGVRKIIAVSPQFSIHSDVVPFDRRYHDLAHGFDPDLGDLSTRQAVGLNGIILVDPFNKKDLVNALMLQNVFPDVRLARLGHGGHPATQTLRHGGTARLVRKLALQPGSDIRPITDAHRAARRQDPNYWLRLAHKTRKRRPRLSKFARETAAMLRK